MKLVKPPEKPKINVLIYGPPKTGKSLGAGTAPGGVLYNNFDLPNSTRLVHQRNPDGRIMEPELPLYQEGQRNLFAHLIEISKEIKKPEQNMIESVVVDTVGELYRRMLEEFSHCSVRPSLPTYGEVSTQVERFCRALCEYPNVNTVIVCHDLLQQNGEELVSIPYTGTKAGSADLGAKLQSMVDVVCYTSVIEQEDGKKEYVAQLIPAKGRAGGDRFACLGDWRSLNISEWIQIIEKHEAKLASANVGTAEKPAEIKQPPKRKAA